MIVVIVIVALLVLIGLYWVMAYNGLIALRNRVDQSFSDIDTQLKRRHDLIPNLVETVKGYAAHERGTLEEVTAARQSAVSAQGPEAQAAAEGILGAALGRLMAVAENYPDLKANQNFLELQRELSATENQIQAARGEYNSQVRQLNTKIQSVPTNIIAGQAGISERAFFELDDPKTERQAPQVSF